MASENDVASKLEPIMRKAIDGFGRANHCAPANIVIFRDGVSQG